MKLKSVFIAGGTGLLGFNSALLLRKLGVQVSTIGLPKELEIGKWFPKDIELSFGDLFTMTEKQIVQLLKQKKYDAFVYALGPDDRVTPPEPAYDFFYDKLVTQAKKVCSAAKKAGVKKCVVMNSYFSHFDKLSRGKLSKYHPYIRARIAQQEELFALGGDKFEVMMLELPYIFGTMPNRAPIWRDSFLANFDGMKSVFFPRGGGTAVVTVDDVAMSVVAACINGKHGESYPIGNINMGYEELITSMLRFKGDNRKYVGLPGWLCALFGAKLNRENKKNGKQSGLNLAKLMTQIQNKKFYIDPNPTQQKLKYAELGFASSSDVMEKIKESIQRCYPK